MNTVKTYQSKSPTCQGYRSEWLEQRAVADSHHYQLQKNFYQHLVDLRDQGSLQIRTGCARLRSAHRRSVPHGYRRIDGFINPFTGEIGPDELIPVESKRGQIKDFSAKSRKRMMVALFSLSIPPDAFLTATYPGMFPTSAEKWKRDLDALTRWLRRYYPHCWFMWKLEPQRRGAPHFHFIGSFGQAVDMKVFRLKFAVAWTNIVGTEGEERRKHIKAGVQADLIEGTYKIRKYCSKYVGKPINGEDLPAWKRPGRFWGVINKKSLPAAMELTVELNSYEINQVRRVFRRWCKSTVERKVGRFGTIKAPLSPRLASYLQKFESCTLFIDGKVLLRLMKYMFPGKSAVYQHLGKSFPVSFFHFTFLEDAPF